MTTYRGNKEARGLTKLGFKNVEPPIQEENLSCAIIFGKNWRGDGEGAFRRCILLPAGGEKGRGQSYFYLVLHHSMDTLRKFLSRIQQI